MKNNSQRSRTIYWDNPEEGLAQAKEMPGIDYLDAMSNGKLPLSPLVATLDFKVEEVMKGQVVFSFEPQEFHYNPIGSVHGGVISAILDSAMGCTLHSLLAPGTGYTTLELKVNFLKAVTTKAGRLKATGKIIYSGSRTALIEASLADGEGKIYAHGTSTCMILKH